MVGQVVDSDPFAPRPKPDPLPPLTPLVYSPRKTVNEPRWRNDHGGRNRRDVASVGASRLRPTPPGLTRHLFKVVHVVRLEVPGAGQHVRFAQQRPEAVHVGAGDAGVSAAVASHAVHEFRAQGPAARAPEPDGGEGRRHRPAVHRGNGRRELDGSPRTRAGRGGARNAALRTNGVDVRVALRSPCTDVAVGRSTAAT